MDNNKLFAALTRVINLLLRKTVVSGNFSCV